MANSDSVLCCCEYINSRGDVAHICELCCDCEALDDACERLVTFRNLPPSRGLEVWKVIDDRIRVPWIGGAKKIGLDVFLPCVLAPSLLLIQAINIPCLVVGYLVTPIVIWLMYLFLLRNIPTTTFFAAWSAVTTAFIFGVYEFIVVGVVRLPKTVSPYENLVLLGFMFLTIRQVVLIYGKVGQTTPCSGARFCRACDSHVVGKDHHCVWINSCITKENLWHFVLFLVFLLVTLIFTGLILLTSQCQSKLFGSIIVYPTNCYDVIQFGSYEDRLVFVSGVHCFVITVPVAFLLCTKVLQLSKMRKQ